MASTKSDNSGCLVLIGIIFLVVFIANTCGGNREAKKDTEIKTNSEQRSNTAYQRQGAVDLPVKKELSDEEKMYLDNSLSTGTMPYSQYYGSNYECPYDQCSGINVTAPVGSDIVVIIKRGNQSGKVVAHGYIRSGASFQFDIPDGTYQTFFYYGRGWNPNKIMKGGIKGGFVKDEIFSKDNPQEIYSGILSYVLQLRTDGNFQTKGSDADEVF